MTFAGVCVLALGVVESTTSLIFLVFCLAGVVLAVVGYLLLRFRVVVRGTVLTSYNYKGGKRSAPGDQIEAIDLGSKAWPTPTRPVTVRVPYVRLKDGSGFWLDPLAGTSADLPARPEQSARLQELRGRLDVGGQEVAPEIPRQN